MKSFCGLSRFLAVAFLSLAGGCGEDLVTQTGTDKLKDVAVLEQELLDNVITDFTPAKRHPYDTVELRKALSLSVEPYKEDGFSQEFEFSSVSSYAHLSLVLDEQWADSLKKLTLQIQTWNPDTESFDDLEFIEAKVGLTDSQKTSFLLDEEHADHFERNDIAVEGRFNALIAFGREVGKVRVLSAALPEVAFRELNLLSEFPVDTKELGATGSLPAGFKKAPLGFTFVPRHMWTSRNPRTPNSKGRWDRVVFHHTATYLPPSSFSACASKARNHLAYHMDTLGWNDVGYNFLICPDGRVFEGRKGGLNTVGAHAMHNNPYTAGVVFMGQYDESAGATLGLNRLTDAAKESAARLAAWIGVETDLDFSKSIPLPSLRNGVQVPPVTYHDFVLKNMRRNAARTNCAGSLVINNLVTTSEFLEKIITYRDAYDGALGSADSFFCPTGSVFDQEYRFCVLEAEGQKHALGPFPEKMMERCEDLGGGQSCRTMKEVTLEGETFQGQRWNLAFAKWIRGTEHCPFGSERSKELGGYCIEDGSQNVYGPFTEAHVQKCRDFGGGKACIMNRWNRGFTRSIVNAN